MTRTDFTNMILSWKEAKQQKEARDAVVDEGATQTVPGIAQNELEEAHWEELTPGQRLRLYTKINAAIPSSYGTGGTEEEDALGKYLEKKLWEMRRGYLTEFETEQLNSGEDLYHPIDDEGNYLSNEEVRKLQLAEIYGAPSQEPGEKEASLKIKGTPVQPKSKEQAEAGNYRKGHTRLHGMDITIENLKGQYRKGKSPDGTEWKTLMKHHYGYIKRTKSDADGDHVDVFIGPDVDSEMVFVVNQTNKGGKGFDEHKCMLGFTNEKDARKGYLDNYEKGWDGLGSITALTMDQFKKWVARGDTSKVLKPLQKVGSDTTGLADKENVTPKDVDKEELKKGKKVEKEHTRDQKLAEEIALDHLTEMPDYYTDLEKMEGKEGKSEYAYSELEAPMISQEKRAALIKVLFETRHIAKTASSMENVKELPRLGRRELTRAVRDAIIEEQKAIKHYETVADSTENRRAAQILQDIADEEKVHVGELEALLEELDPTDEDFREEGEEEVEEMDGAPEEEGSSMKKEASGRSWLVQKTLEFMGKA